MLLQHNYHEFSFFIFRIEFHSSHNKKLVEGSKHWQTNSEGKKAIFKQNK